jgi:hypothetical protein
MTRQKLGGGMVWKVKRRERRAPGKGGAPGRCGTHFNFGKAGRKVWGMGFRRDAENDPPEACAPRNATTEMEAKAQRSTTERGGAWREGWKTSQ